MSGPKVVRIVTREELISICEGHLAQAQAAIDAWVRVGRRNDCVSEQDIEVAQARLSKLRALLAAGRFADVQKQAPQEVNFLREDLEARLAKVAEAAAAARSADRRRAHAAKSLIAALYEKGRAIPAELEARLLSAGGAEDARALAQAFALLEPDPTDVSDAQRALAQRLKETEGSRSFSAWAAANISPPDDATVIRLEQHLAALNLTAGGAATAAFEARLVAAQADQTSRRSLLLDSLALDLSTSLARARARAKSQDRLQLVLAELRQVDSAAANDIERQAQADEDIDGLTRAGQEQLDAHRTRLAAEVRRTAVLEALAGLGYEVSEGLATAWADQGRVVLRKPAQTGYGVELAGDAATSRMQMRVVAFDGEAGADAARDKDAETLWCGDVTALESSLAAAGGGLVIERATPVGGTPVKRVPMPTAALSRDAREGPASQTRTIS